MTQPDNPVRITRVFNVPDDQAHMTIVRAEVDSDLNTRIFRIRDEKDSGEYVGDIHACVLSNVYWKKAWYWMKGALAAFSAVRSARTSYDGAGLHHRAGPVGGTYIMVGSDGAILWEAIGPIAAIKLLRRDLNRTMTLMDAKNIMERARADGRTDVVWPDRDEQPKETSHVDQ